MPKRVAEVREGNEDGNGVYGFIRDLIVEGKDARFVNKKGRYIIRWSKALDRYLDFKSKKNPQFKSKKFDRRKASNGLRSALLNFYKKDGAKEYKESKKVNENDEVVERQFQMPPRVLESLFKDVKLPEDSEPDEQDTSSVNSEGETDAHSPPNSSSSDAGFDETMDATFDDTSGIIAVPNNSTILGIPSNPCLNFIKTEEDGDVFLPDTILPSEMFDESAVDSALEEICSDGISDDISEDLDLLGVVQDILPTSGSVKGGYQFNISLTEQLPDDITSGIVQFEGVANVQVQKLNPFTLTGIVPASLQPGDVPVTVLTVAGQRLGMTCFRYIDEMREMVRQMVKDPDLQLRFAICSQEYGFFGADSNVSQVLGPLNMQNQDSSTQTKQQQSLKVLQLLVYTAAETDARQFIEMIFSTSAGRIIFNSYKDKTPLPEDVARANGHEDLAQYLQDVNIRLSKEVSSEVLSNVIDWLEIVKAVQKQASAGQDEPSSRQKHPSENDDNSSDYFADAETSSCGSFDMDEASQSDLEDRKSNNEGFCTKDAALKKEPNQSPATCMEGPLAGIPNQKVEPPGDKVDTGTRRWWHSYSLTVFLSKVQGKSLPTFGRFPGVTFFSGLFDKGGFSGQANEHSTGQPRTSKPKDCGQSNHRRSSRRAAPGLKYKGFLLACVMVTVLAGLKLGEGYVLHWTVGNGYTQISKLLLHCGLFVDAPGVFKETPLHIAAKHGFKDLVDVLVQSGGNVNARNFPSRETPLHLAVRNGHQYIAEFLIKHGSEVNVRNAPWQETPLHLAARNGHQYIAEVLIKHGSEVNIRNAPWRNTPLHFATYYGHSQVVDILLQRGSDINARNKWQEIPLHLAARHGLQHIAETSIQLGSKVNARSDPSQDTPLHLAAKNGHSQMANILLQHGGDFWARIKPLKTTPLHRATQNGHRQVTADILLQETLRRKLSRNLLQDTSLHMVAQNGHQHIAESLMQHGGEVNTQNFPLQGTPCHLAAGSSHQQITTWMLCQCLKLSMARDPSSFGGTEHGSRIQHGNQVSAQSHPWQETPLHLVEQNGPQHVAASFIQHGGEVNAQNVPWGGASLHFHAPSPHLCQERNNSQLLKVLLIRLLSIAGVKKVLRKETACHLASRNGHVQHEGDAFARNLLRQETLIHLSARNGHQPVAKSLKRRGSMVNTRNTWQETPLHLAAGKKNKQVAQGSAHQENARGPHYFIQTNTKGMPQNSSVYGSYHQNTCEVQTCYEMSDKHPEERSKNNVNGLLMGDALLPKGPSADQHQQDCTLTCSDQCQQTNQTSEDSSVNTSDQHKQTRKKMLKLMIVIGGILIFCFVVACLLWYKHQIRVLAANGSTEPMVSPSPEPLLECPNVESLHMVDLVHTTKLVKAVQHDVREHEADLFIVRIAIENVNMEELRLERVRSWLNNCIVPEEVILEPKGDNTLRNKFLKSPKLIDGNGKEEDGQETSSVTSEVEIEKQEAPSSSFCDTGYREVVNIDCKEDEKLSQPTVSLPPMDSDFIGPKREFGNVGTHVACDSSISSRSVRSALNVSWRFHQSKFSPRVVLWNREVARILDHKKPCILNLVDEIQKPENLFTWRCIGTEQVDVDLQMLPSVTRKVGFHLRILSREDVQSRVRMKMNDCLCNFHERRTHFCKYCTAVISLDSLARENLCSHCHEAMQIGGLPEMFSQSSDQETRSTITVKLPLMKPEISPEQEALKSSGLMLCLILLLQLLLEQERLIKRAEHLCAKELPYLRRIGQEMLVVAMLSEQEQRQELMKLLVELLKSLVRALERLDSGTEVKREEIDHEAVVKSFNLFLL